MNQLIGRFVICCFLLSLQMYISTFKITMFLLLGKWAQQNNWGLIRTGAAAIHSFWCMFVSLLDAEFWRYDSNQTTDPHRSE